MADIKKPTTTTTAKPAAKTATPVKPATPAAKTATPVRPATPAAKTATPVRPATPAAKTATPVRPATPAAKTATPVKPATPAAKTATPARPATPAAKTATPVRPATPAAKATTPVSRTTVAPAKETAATKTATTATAQPAATTAAAPRTASELRAAALSRPATKQTEMPDPKVRVVTDASAAVSSTSAKKADKTEKPAKESKIAKADKKAAKASSGKALVAADKKSTAVARTDKKSSAKTSKSGGAAASALDPKKKKIIIISVVAAVLVIALIIILAVCIPSCAHKDGELLPFDPSFSIDGEDEHKGSVFDEIDPNDGLPTEVFSSAYVNKTKVGYKAEYLGTVERTLPNGVSDGGLVANGTIDAYPKFGQGSSLDQTQRQAVINENWNLCSINTRIGSDGYPQNTYDKMDKDGYLYLRGERTGGQLYKHTGSVGLWYSDVSDDEQAIVKRFTFDPRGYESYNVTGMYAPAGEIIKIEVSKADMQAAGNSVLIHIGQALYNRKANNIWAARGLNRMPVILNTMLVTPDTAEFDEERQVYTGYVGSFLGGPIYIGNASKTFSVTVSGGVRYSHFILGYTTPEEFAENAKSTAPYFDLEVREYGVLHSGPVNQVKNLSYDDLYTAAVMWEKIALVSTQITRQGIVFLYEPFVAAGAAVAFPGQYSVNCPTDWMAGSLNYNAFVNSGSWGNMHEYNHNFQGWGLPDGGEVTNNAVNLVEYSLFTRISANRRLGAGGDGLDGWNRYTSPGWAAMQVSGSRENDLSIYATLLHAFGQDNFIKVAAAKPNGIDNYFNKFAEVTHNDMTYYSSLVGKNMSSEATSAMKAKGYSMFVPVATVYQTGRSYKYDGETHYIQTAQPYKIRFGEDFTLDLRPYTTEGGMYTSGSIVIPADFNYTVKSITQPEYGTIVNNGDNVFTYKPDGEHTKSGKIRVTLGITKKNGSFKVDDVELIIELEQSHEMNKSMLERVTYTYEDVDAMPESAQAAFESKFAGASSVVSADNANPTQNGNTEIWTYDVMSDNAFYEIRGKFYIDETAKYRLALRGRWDCALYTSVNSNEDKDFKLAAYVQTTASHANFYTEANTYCDIEDLKAGDWLYFRAVVRSTNQGGKNAYIGLGWGKFTPATGTINENGEIEGAGEETVTVQYANAYRNSYQFTDTSFTSNYKYVRNYTYTYNDTIEYTPVYSADGKEYRYSVVETNYRPWTDAVSEGWYDISHLFDGRLDTYIHTARDQWISADNPLTMTIDAGSVITANRFNVYGWTEKSMSNIGFPTAFKLEFKNTPDGEVVYSKEFSGVKYGNNKNAIVNLGETVKFRYAYLTITASDNGRVALTSLSFSYVTEYVNGTVVSCDSENIRYRGDWKTESAYCSFGHIYVGNDDAVCEFKFSGDRFALFAMRNKIYGTFEVYIDGEKVGVVNLSGNSTSPELVYLSDGLKDGEHFVSIRSTGDKINIDSFVTWGE
ncbi:MAG: hypothetical protein HDT28_05360 [Clostridiales bacterium]|nr:hypothetical protein [Clostridiales bacterium]